MDKSLLSAEFENYERISAEEISDIESLGVVLRHKKSGARIALLSNEDNNKVFYIAFRTTPFDSTGVPHIIEHTVLCGSDKYPVKDPFISLAKSSLNTFLNAITYPDKTVYPVASCNDQDIKNLMDVYMDAVLHPNIYHHEEIFKQEGWHYELEKEDAELKINGVVYSEMKGAYSSPDEVVEDEILHSLFPDTTYGVDSGGNPDVIPTLSYEAYLDFHRRYYHPSNSYIYLYGNFDMKERLEWLDKEYLSKYDFQPVDSEVKLQPGFTETKYINTTYPIGAEEDTKDKAYLSYSIMTGDAGEDLKKSIALTMLNIILIGVQGAPVRQALLDAGICKNINGSYNCMMRQPYFEIVASKADASDRDKFVKIIEDELKKCAENGVNHDSLLAILNTMEFSFREADTGNTPRGLVNGLNMLDTWLYDDSRVFTKLKRLNIFAELRKEIESGYYEKLIETELLNNTHKLILVAEPDPGLTDRKEEALRKKLADKKAAMSEDEIKELVRQTEALRAYQEEEDSEEAIATLPVLKVSDVDKKATLPVNEERECCGTKTVFHDLPTNGIAYVGVYFDAEKIEDGLVPYLSLLTDILGAMSTEKYSYLELANEIGKYSGNLRMGFTATADVKDRNHFYKHIVLNFKSLEENIPKCFELGPEMMTKTKLGDKKRLKEVLGEMYTAKQGKMVSSGHMYAIDRAFAYTTPQSAYEELASGIAYYDFIKGLYENFDEQADDIISKLEYLVGVLVRSDNMLLSIGSREKEYKAFEEAFSTFKNDLTDREKEYPEIEKPEVDGSADPLGKLNEAFKISGQIQYCAAAGNFLDAGLRYNGSVPVLKTIMGLEYLWMNLRVKGGAYGCFLNVEKTTGNIGMVSYRDPNLKNTYNIYKEAADYVRNLNISQEEIDKYIIGTMSNVDLPMLPRTMNDYSMTVWIQGRTNEAIQKERDEILSTTCEDINKLAAFLDCITEAGCICTIGSAGKLDEEGDIFKSVRELN